MNRATRMRARRPVRLPALRWDPRLLAVVVVVVLAIGLGWAQATRPAAVETVAGGATSVPIEGQTLVCPQAGGVPIGGAAHIAYADADPDPVAAANSSVTAAPLGPDGIASTIAVQAGHAWNVDGPTTLGPVRVDMTGLVASTSSAVQVIQQTIGGTLQASNVPCEAPTTDAWFAGFASGVGDHATLLLSNVDTVAATVDIGIYGDSAPPNADADHDLVVAPQAQVAVRLDTLAPGFANAVAHVTATSGRIVPAIRYDTENGALPLGVEWIPRTQAPALEQTVPGFVDGAGSRRLILSTPGDVDATASVEVVTADGSFTPTGFEAIDVPSGQVVSVDLDPQLQAEAGAVVVTSTEPVVAGGVSVLPLDKAGGSDIGFTAAVPALTGPAVVAGGETGDDVHTKVLLTVPGDADAHLTLTLLPSAAASSPLVSPLTVSAGTTLTLDLGSISADPAPAIELTPDSGDPVYAAWTFQQTTAASAALTTFPIRSAATSLQRPPARSDLLAGLPGWPAVVPSPSPSAPLPIVPAPSLEPSFEPSEPAESSSLPSSPAAPDPQSSSESSQPSP